MRVAIVAMMALLLAACGSPQDESRIPTQKWGDIVIEVRSQPVPVVVGMNEFLVLATLVHGRPVHDLVVSLRSSDQQPWQQTIQDGFSGVYRKAVDVPPGVTQLHVQLRKKRTEEEVELVFPLFPPAAPAPQ